MRTVAFLTLGCKTNQYDSQAMLEAFVAQGYRAVPFEAQADVYVINTCTVTGTGDQKSLKAIRRALRQNPAAEVVVAGCLAQRSGQGLLAQGVRLVIGTQRRGEVVYLLHQAIDQGKALVAVGDLADAGFEAMQVTAHEGRTRAVLKIQEGCDNRCSYCIIPSVRGPVRSRPLAEVAAEARRLGEAGFLEVVLTGIHLSSYGRDQVPRLSLTDAIGAVHDAPGIRRIRLGSLEPRVVTQAFVRTLKAMPKVCPQFHLALQSGSDAVLAAMRRQYNTAQFLGACGLLREAFPGCAITTDVLCGFPGENQVLFEQTLETIRQAGFARIHAFPYSEREGTDAAAMPGTVTVGERGERARQVIALGQALAAAYRRQWIGQGVEVLFETVDEAGVAEGYTTTYLRVRVPGGVPGHLDQVLVTGEDGEGLLGER